MYLPKQIILCFVLVLINLGITAQDLPPNPKHGKCYAKCAAPPVYEEIERTFHYYVGDKNDEIRFDSLYFEIEFYSGDLIYVGTKAELSNEQLKQIDNFYEIVIVKDEIDLEETVAETLIYKRKIRGGEMDWAEVVCDVKINMQLIKQIETRLIEEEYLEDLEDSPKGIYTKEVKEALKAYQRANYLPVGNLNIATLKSLRIY